jgi:trk system potassium uptake protein TrkH
MVISFIVLLMCGVDVDVAFSGTLSSVGNVGHGIGRIGTIGNFNFLTSVPKIVFTMDMVLGRLEIFPVLVVISMLFHRGDK